MSRRGPDRLALATLAVVLAFTTSVLTVTLVDAWAARSLPGDPEAFRALYLALRSYVFPFVMPLGFASFLLALLDMARARSLRERRAALRVAMMLPLLAMSVVGAVTLGPFVEIVEAGALDGVALKAAFDALAPSYWLQRVLVLSVMGLAIAAHRAPLPPAGRSAGSAGSAEGERYPSAWIPPLLGETPALPARQWRVLGLMIAAGFFNAYDGAIFSLALKQIQAGLGIAESQIGLLGSAVRLGVVPGALIVLFADVIGRRRVLLLTIVGYTLCTGLTALAPNDWSFAVCQFGARSFGAAEAILATVVVAEEVDPDQRGWAIGVLASLAGLGIALAWMLFAFIDVLPFGWRSLYLVGLGPLLLITLLRRRLPETERFERARRATAAEFRGLSAGFAPLRALVRAYPRRFLAVSAAGFLMSFSGQSAGFFFPKYLQETFGISPQQLVLLGASVGVMALAATPLLGRLGDRRGRKRVALLFIVLNPLTVVGLYNVALPFLVLVCFVGMSLSDIGSDTNLNTFAKEMFPTSHRSTAGGAAAVIAQLGGSLGLAGESLLFGVLGSHGMAVSALALSGLIVPVIVAWGYPETAGRPLEETAPER